MKKTWTRRNTEISKVSESCILNQIIRHLDDYAPLPNYQSAYMANHGCETALLKLFDDILWCFERKYICVLCKMDLSAAFDTMDHDLLLTMLKIQAEANKWIESYLRPRGIRVKVGSAYSTTRDTPFSFP